jgi:hypothetical protein
MARIRTIKPEFFRNEKLQDLHNAHPELQIMMLYIGLWTLCDNQGVFEWKPRSIKLDILPFVDYDIAESLELLMHNGFIIKFQHEEKLYGYVPNFLKHQRLPSKEVKEGKRYPEPLQHRFVSGSEPVRTQFATGSQQGLQEGKGREEKEKEKERTTDYAQAREIAADEFEILSPEEDDFPNPIDKNKIPEGIQGTPGGAAPRPWDELSVAQCLDQLRGDWQFIESIQRMYSIDPSIIPEWMDVYELWKTARDGPTARVSDVRRHFINWLRGRDLTKPAKVFKDEPTINGKKNGSGAQHSGFDLLIQDLDDIIQDSLRDNPM